MSESEKHPPGTLFARAVDEVAYGQLSADLSEELANVVKAVKRTGGKGSLTLTLTVKPRGRDSGQVELSGEVKPKIPQAPVAPSMLFATDEGDLVRDNPAQATLPLNFVNKKAANE